MRMSQPTRTALCAVLMVAAACGGGNSVTGTNNNGNCVDYKATVAGSAWCALSVVANYYTSQQQVVITGTSFSTTGTTYAVTLSASAITGPGTYNLSTTVPLRFAVVGSSTGVGYTTTVTGSSGTITFTTITSTHAVGTFSFTAVANTGGTGTIQVTNGSFDVPLTPAS
jgi:hypothetical protein